MAPFGASRAGLMSVRRDAIPDNGLLHDFNPESLDLSDSDTVESWSDSEGSLTVTGSAKYVETGHADKPAVEFNRSDGDVLSETDADVSQEFAIFAVSEANDDGNFQDMVGSTNDREIELAYDFRSDNRNYRITAAGDGFVGGDVTTDPIVYSGLIQDNVGDGSELRINKNVEGTSDDTQGLINGITIGERRGGEDGSFDGKIYRILIYDTDDIDKDGIEEIEDGLIDKYSVPT